MIKKITFILILQSIGIVLLASDNKHVVRETIPLNDSWNFCVDSLSIGKANYWEVNGLPQSSSTTVTVPHVWNVYKGLENYWGKCWYERKFEISTSNSGKIFRLQFDAVYHDAIIYINGHKAGEHIGSGYNRFFINITPFITAGQNTVTVQVSNYASRNNIPFLKSYDWAHDGGIYRNVFLVITDPVAIKNIHAVGTPNGSKGIAIIDLSFIDNSKIEISKLKLLTTITEENQSTKNKIFESELNGNFENGHFKSSLDLDNIKPWHFDSPNLYKLTVKLLVNGTPKDEFSTVFGFRSIKVENNRYVLNGEPIRLMGVEWMPGSTLKHGMAETTADFEKNLILMKNANCIFTRFHWQQDEYVFDWCDRHGILIQEEIPYWGSSTMINDTLFNLGVQHLNEMTDNHYNHPSIISWGIGNELVSSNIQNVDYLKKLYYSAKNIDSSRLVNFVSNKIHRSRPGDKDYLPDATAGFDMIMFNEYYSTWYNQSLDVVGPELDRIEAQYSGKPITISEWGLCEPVHRGGDSRRAKEMVQQLKIYSSKEYVAGAIYFCLNDYRTHMGEDFTYVYPQRVHGVCDINSNPKPSYEVLKEISAPVIVKSVSFDDAQVTVTLSVKTSIPSYIIRNYTIVCGSEKVQIDELKPGEDKTFQIKTQANEFVIFRPTGFEVGRFKFR